MMEVQVLTYKRLDFLKRTVETFIEKNPKLCEELTFRILIQEATDDEVSAVHNFGLFNEIHVTALNIGNSLGYNMLSKASLRKKPEFILHLEDDWESLESLEPYMEEIEIMFRLHPDVGQIRLRNFKSRVCKSNKITGERVLQMQCTPTIYKGAWHFTLNPTITRASVIKSIIPFPSELMAVKNYHALGLQSAQLHASVFSHIGNERSTNWKP